jgi:hypothetical protein
MGPQISRRKRDGVYYTPEWIAAYVVEQTLGRVLSDVRRELQMPDAADITDDEIHAWHSVSRYAATLEIYAARLETIRVLDPACGVGVFLIEALRRLLQERRWLALERDRIEQTAPRAFDADAAIRATLSNNLYGVDIDAESVEATKLALRRHMLHPRRPLAALDQNVRAGNSLLDASYERFVEARSSPGASEPGHARADTFNWAAVFPEVFERGGFDCILGNPPYVKYQHLRRVNVTVAEYLRFARRTDGSLEYESAEAGNFDIYLPFIEKGIRLLNPRGRMGLIAPSLWTKHAHGEGLRRFVRARQCLERWIDFGDFQVFEEATTYTALQFFVGWRSETISCRSHASADLCKAVWDGPGTATLRYSTLPERGAWSFVGEHDAELLARLGASHRRLEEFVDAICVGVQTSADAIFHLQEICPGTYRNGKGEVVPLEPGILRPIVSGADVRRYVKPETTARILFPYAEAAQGGALVPEATMGRAFPRAWAYLRRHEPTLRAREGGKFDDGRWYRFGRSQNIDKQHLRKVLVPRLVRRLALTPDLGGDVVADNVDVGYLIIDDHETMWYLVGVCNCAVADWYVRHTAKPFRGGYFSANKQYLAPIPIPVADAEVKAEIGRLARQLTTTWTKRAAVDRGLDQELCGHDETIANLEQQLDDLVFTLYGLTQADIARVRGG